MAVVLKEQLELRPSVALQKKVGLKSLEQVIRWGDRVNQELRRWRKLEDKKCWRARARCIRKKSRGSSLALRGLGFGKSRLGHSERIRGLLARDLAGLQQLGVLAQRLALDGVGEAKPLHRGNLSVRHLQSSRALSNCASRMATFATGMPSPT